jgi:hypothetical protein
MVIFFGVGNGAVHFSNVGRFGVQNGEGHFVKGGRFGGGHISNSLVKFRITSPDPSACSFVENVISAAEMETKSAIAHTLRSLEWITPTW